MVWVRLNTPRSRPEVEAAATRSAEVYPFIDLGLFRLPTYGLMLCVAILLGVSLGVKRTQDLGIDREFAYAYLSLTVVVALLGAKLTDWIIARGALSLNTLAFGEGTFLGGFLLAVLGLLPCRRPSEDPAAAVGRCLCAVSGPGRGDNQSWMLCCKLRLREGHGPAVGCRLYPTGSDTTNGGTARRSAPPLTAL